MKQRQGWWEKILLQRHISFMAGFFSGMVVTIATGNNPTANLITFFITFVSIYSVGVIGLWIIFRCFRWKENKKINL